MLSVTRSTSITDEPRLGETGASRSNATTREIMKYSEFDYIQAGYLFERRRAKLARFERMLAREYQEHKNKAVFLFNRGRLEARSCI